MYSFAPYTLFAFRCGNNFVNAIDPLGKEYLEKVDSVNQTITIHAIYYASSEDKTSAEEAVAFWNSLSNKFEYNIETQIYEIIFDLHVVTLPNHISKPENRYEVNRWIYIGLGRGSMSFDNVYQVIDLGEENLNGKTLWHSNVLVDDSRRETDTGAHEIGHTLHLYHSEEGIMTEASTDINRGRFVTDENIKDIIIYPLNRSKLNVIYTSSTNFTLKHTGTIKRK